MNDKVVIFNQVAVLFIVMLVGVYAKRKNIITEIVGKKLSELLLQVTMPLLIISSFLQTEFSKEMLVNAAIVFAISMGIHVFSSVLGIFIYRGYPVQSQNVLKFITLFSNCAFMGFPVLKSVYGSIGIFYGSIYIISFNLFLWTYGVIIFDSGNKMNTLKKAFINPGIIAVLIGMVIFVFSIKIPEPIANSISMVGGLTTPISMLIIGALIAGVDPKNIFSGFSVYYASFVRLIAIPAITLLILKFIGTPTTLIGINVVSAAMPAAANTAIFTEMYNGDSVLASRIIAISTMFSIVTIPIIISFV